MPPRSVHSVLSGVVLLLLLVAGTPGGAREKDPLKMSATAAAGSQTCFRSGSGETFLHVCITHRGTLSHFESPAGLVHLTVREGYVVCSNGSSVHGFDAGSAEAGWAAPTVTQPNGTSKLPLIITRTSVDGKVRFTQTFTLSTAGREVAVRMALKNLSGSALPNVLLTRYFDGDIDATSSDDLYDHTLQDSVWGLQPRDRTAVPSLGRGLMLTLAQTAVHRHFFAESFAEWNPLGSRAQDARQCVPAGSLQRAPTVAGDHVGRLVVHLETINPSQTKAVLVLYRRF